MIPTIVINLKSNTFLILFLTCLFLSLFSKRVRRVVLTSNVITLILVALQKLGLGYYSDKIISSTFEGINKLQTILNDRRDFLSVILSFDFNTYKSYLYNLNQLFMSVKAYLIRIDFSIKNLAIIIKARLNTLKNEIVRRINISKLTLNYRI